MRPDEFRDSSPGDLVTIPGGWAFVPHQLPPTIAMSWELAAALDRATRALATLDGQAQLIPNKALIVRPLLTREATLSAQLEGTHTQIAGVLLQGADVLPSDPSEELSNREVLNYLAASSQAERWLDEQRPISLTLLRGLHATLLTGTRGQRRRPGEFRPGQVVIGSQGSMPAQARFVPPHPEQVQPALDNLLRYIVDGVSHPPLIAAGIAHYQFETIHPFEDGNGRLGRLLILLHLLALGTVRTPLVYLSPYFEAHRDEYLQRLRDVSTDGSWVAWLLFFLNAVENQANDAYIRVERILALQQQYRAAALQIPSRVVLPTIDFLMEHLIVTAPEVASHVGCTYATARSALDALVDVGITVRLSASHPQRWWAHDLVARMYEQ
jgi:Fic family protein